MNKVLLVKSANQNFMHNSTVPYFQYVDVPGRAQMATDSDTHTHTHTDTHTYTHTHTHTHTYIHRSTHMHDC